jgi:signal transduction histidine kinase
MKALIIEDEEKAVAYLKKGLTENGFVVDTERDGIAGLARARSAELFQSAVGNLVHNAIAATPPGGSVWIRAAHDGPDVSVEVSDTGR